MFFVISWKMYYHEHNTEKIYLFLKKLSSFFLPRYPTWRKEILVYGYHVFVCLREDVLIRGELNTKLNP